jgi:signal transduction histidine kinase
MRRRLLATYLTLLTAVMVGLVVPLAVVTANQNAQQVFIDRRSDTARFASLAEPAIRSGHTVALHAELAGYDELYGIGAAVVTRDGNVLVSSRPDLELSDPDVSARVRAALSGERPGHTRAQWPWRDYPLVVAEPVGRGGEIIGAAVTISPTEPLRAATWRSWGLLVAVTLLVLAAGAVAALPLTRWMLRPVAHLDDVTHAITEGRHHARVQADEGPPELRRLAMSFNTMADTITTLLQRQRSFVSYASHQLRNPLAALRLRVDDLSEHLTDEGRADHALSLEEVDRLTRICDGLLAVARADAAPVQPVVVDAGAVADQRIEAWRPVAGRTRSRLIRAGAAHAPVRTTASTLDQTLDVLIDNALKFASPQATITVDVRAGAAGQVHVHVIDDGPGLPADELRKATRLSWSDAPRSSVDGNGLGLAIVTTLLDSGGGELHLMPARPHGVDARITLPAGGR